MSTIHGRKQALATALVCAAVVAGALGTLGHPAQAVQQKEPHKVEAAPFYYGSRSCAGCHDRKTPFEDKDNLPICRCTEMEVFETKDKHGIAQQILLGERSRELGRQLNIAEPASAPQCVSCHSVRLGEKDRTLKSFRKEEGVSCVACHGPDRGWLDVHYSKNEVRRAEWRGLPRSEKQQKYGMTDLWDPVKRTALCASCHIGSAPEGKVVTHAMYAAGHPPLPGFEVATFSDAMPRHWQYLKEKPRAVQELLGFDKAEAEQEQTTLLSLGGLVSLRESLKLLADQARAGADWPELAQFDCYACHHDLRSKSWRPQRTTPGKPGRPTMPPWPRVLAELGAAEGAEGQGTDGGKALRTKLAAVDDLFAAQPYGDPDKIRKTAADLAEWVDQQIKALRRRKPDNTAPRRLLGRLLELQTEGVPDYDSARQFGRALEVLQRQIDADAARQVQKSPSWKALDASLGLTIPVGKEELLPTLPTSLQRLNAYHPTQFGKEFKAVAAEFQQLADKEPPAKTGK